MTCVYQFTATNTLLFTFLGMPYPVCQTFYYPQTTFAK